MLASTEKIQINIQMNLDKPLSKIEAGERSCSMLHPAVAAGFSAVDFLSVERSCSNLPGSNLPGSNLPARAMGRTRRGVLSM